MAALTVAFASATARSRPKPKPQPKREKKVVYPSVKEPVRLAGLACGNPKLRADLDWPSFRSQLRDAFTAEVAAGLCGAVLEGVKAACEGTDRKIQPGKRLSRVRCGYRREAFRLQVERRGKELRVFFTGETPNLADEMKEWLLSRF